MPLPAALAARLKKRGLIKEKENKQEEVEEVFAEDYDDPQKEVVAQPEPELPPQDPTPIEQNQELIFDVAACPNRSNPYHTCAAYCAERWGMRKFTASPSMTRKRDRMLRKFPLPEGWEEVADPETNRFYYWNTLTDQVSWLSPTHPRAQITMSAERLQEVLGDTAIIDTSQEELRSDDEDIDMRSDDDVSSSSSSSSESEDEDYDRRRKGRRYDDDSKGRDRGGGRSRGRQKREELDPMDPAAYSEAPRGTWSTGLASRGEAKTGADVTVSGPLFQQRPYPSPGEILRRNKEQQK
ncbi:hypothetical protein FSP39_019546 [Pinctada imbricata]|uniref:WW domain-containing protein n=1 Tax=Pinctada imbricata TaxID=66713 RepID=A0AA88YQ69_PINIB|nr:hypothetical protein FSP39_019546 [Pinctada imbricata]